MDFIKADWQAPQNVIAFTTTRGGGVSRSPFDSLNLGKHVGDQADAVERNRKRLLSEALLPSAANWLEQVHSTNVLDLKSQLADTVCADGAVTGSVKVVCAIMTADCLPLFLSSKAGDSVGVLHVGWRGLADGIVENGVKAMNVDPDQLVAWAGPAIGPTRFEIGAEVRAQIGGSDAAYVGTPAGDKYLANLYLLAGERLAALGVQEYTHCTNCTYNDDELFFSYRRSAKRGDGKTGRMASLIWML